MSDHNVLIESGWRPVIQLDPPGRRWLDYTHRRNMAKIDEESARKQAEIDAKFDHRSKVWARAYRDPQFARWLNAAVERRGNAAVDEVVLTDDNVPN